MGGSNLTSSQRAEAERKAAELTLALSAEGEANYKARAVILMRVIRAGGGAALTELAAEAKALAYRDAVDDMPAWAIGEAARRWNRGECGDHNYNFPPAPAVLRQIVEAVLAPYRITLDKVETILNAVTLERAMDPAPIEHKNALLPRLKAV